MQTKRPRSARSSAARSSRSPSSRPRSSPRTGAGSRRLSIGRERALALAEADGIRIGQSGHRWVLGFIELSLGDAAAALPNLRRSWEIRDSVRVLEPGHRLDLADTLEALIAVGELDEAEQKLVPWEERAGALDRSWALAITARCRALLLAARGDNESAFASFEQALAEHARTTDPFQHARTLLALGRTQRRAKRRGDARRDARGRARALRAGRRAALGRPDPSRAGADRRPRARRATN